MKPDTDIDLLERFVQSFARLDDLHCSQTEPPPQSMLSGIDSEDWNFIQWSPTKLAIPRTDLEQVRRIGPLPSLFESFAVSFAWLAVDLRVCRLFSNPPTGDLRSLADAMFSDRVLNDALLPVGLVRFALAPNSCYDPICFDLTRFDGDDCPIVRLEHESILIRDQIDKRVTIFDSFRSLVDAVIHSAN